MQIDHALRIKIRFIGSFGPGKLKSDGLKKYIWEFDLIYYMLITLY